MAGGLKARAERETLGLSLGQRPRSRPHLQESKEGSPAQAGVAAQQLTAGAQGAAPGGERGGERFILTSTGISSSDTELAGLSLAEGVAATLLVKP